MLEKFKKFEIKKQEIVLGGTIWESIVIYSDGSPAGSDYYDDVTDRWFEICDPIT